MAAAYAEGMNILRQANIGKAQQPTDVETTSLREPRHCQYDSNLADIAEVWRRGSMIASWLLDLTASALRQSVDLTEFSSRESDSGGGRWTLVAAFDEAIPDLQRHLAAGAKTVILSAPAKSQEVSTMVHRVNTTNGPTTGIISCASCTTNRIAPVVEDMGR